MLDLFYFGGTAMATGLLTKASVRAELEHAELQISDEIKN